MTILLGLFLGISLVTNAVFFKLLEAERVERKFWHELFVKKSKQLEELLK